MNTLQELQWCSRAYGAMGETAPSCPECGGIKNGASLFIGRGEYKKGEGHKKDCKLFKILDRGNAE